MLLLLSQGGITIRLTRNDSAKTMTTPSYSYTRNHQWSWFMSCAIILCFQRAAFKHYPHFLQWWYFLPFFVFVGNGYLLICEVDVCYHNTSWKMKGNRFFSKCFGWTVKQCWFGNYDQQSILVHFVHVAPQNYFESYYPPLAERIIFLLNMHKLYPHKREIND